MKNNTTGDNIMTHKQYLIKTLNRILKEIDELCDQSSQYSKFEDEVNKLYTTVDLILEKIENSSTK